MQSVALTVLSTLHTNERQCRHFEETHDVTIYSSCTLVRPSPILLYHVPIHR